MEANSCTQQEKINKIENDWIVANTKLEDMDKKIDKIDTKVDKVLDYLMDIPKTYATKEDVQKTKTDLKEDINKNEWKLSKLSFFMMTSSIAWWGAILFFLIKLFVNYMIW